MKKSPCPHLQPAFVVLLLSVSLAWPAAATARTYTLPDLLDLARRSNPGLAASAQQT
jgi:hypothetical protein